MLRREAISSTALFLAMAVIIGAILMPVFSRARENARRSSCQSNLKQVGLAFAMYSADRGFFPADRIGNTGRGWTEEIQPYLKSLQLLRCPSAPDGPIIGDYVGAARTDYFMNSRFARYAHRSGSSWETAAYSVLLGDGVAGVGPTNADYAIAAIPPAWRTSQSGPAKRHLDGANYGFADGHVKWLPATKRIGTASPRLEMYTLGTR